MYAIEPIGYFKTEADERYAVGRQAGIVKSNGKIILNPGLEQGLEDLEGFERIWLIYGFHRNDQWKLKVLPPRGEKKRGVFATRSPHRPNFLGLSCVKLISVKGLTLDIEEHDLLDGTPIFDIKPYLTYADAYPTAKQGWLEDLESQKKFSLAWSSQALAKAEYLESQWSIGIEENIAPRLQVNPFPSKNNRIRALEGDLYEIAYKTWRASFKIDGLNILIQDVYSGYKPEETTSKWNDLHIHKAFREYF